MVEHIDVVRQDLLLTDHLLNLRFSQLLNIPARNTSRADHIHKLSIQLIPQLLQLILPVHIRRQTPPYTDIHRYTSKSKLMQESLHLLRSRTGVDMDEDGDPVGDLFGWEAGECWDY